MFLLLDAVIYYRYLGCLFLRLKMRSFHRSSRNSLLIILLMQIFVMYNRDKSKVKSDPACERDQKISTCLFGEFGYDMQLCIFIILLCFKKSKNADLNSSIGG